MTFSSISSIKSTEIGADADDIFRGDETSERKARKLFEKSFSKQLIDFWYLLPTIPRMCAIFVFLNMGQTRPHFCSFCPLLNTIPSMTLNGESEGHA